MRILRGIEWLADKNVKDALANLACMNVLLFPFLEFEPSSRGLK